MSVQVSYRKQFILGILLVLVFVITIEGFARVYDYTISTCEFVNSGAFKIYDFFLARQICLDTFSVRSYEPEQYDPPIIFLKPDFNSPTININSYGFRGPEISKIKADSTYRIFLLGGSTAQGAGSSSDETTISGYLQKKFDNVKLENMVEVINGGVSAFESFRETYYVKNTIIDFDPDLLIVYDGINDGGVSGNEVDANGKYIIPKKIESNAESEIRGFFSPSNYWFYRTPFVIYDLFTGDKPGGKSLVSQEMVSLWKERWLEICDLGNKEGFRTMVLIQPHSSLGFKNFTVDELDVISEPENYEGFKINVQLMVDALPDLNKKCEKTADIRNVFENTTETLYFDDAHVIDKGNEIVAEKIFELTLPIVEESLS